MLNKIFERLDGIFCDPEGKPCFQGSEGDRQEYINIRNAALTQPKADVDTLMKDVYAAYENDDDSHKKSTGAWVIDHLAAQGYIGVPEGWMDIAEIPDNLISGVDLWDDRNEKRHINCTFNLRLQAWADENFSFVEIPTHWMPIPAAPKKEGV